MRKTLTLSKETLRILDDEDLAMVAGGGDPSDHGGHGKTGQHGSCNGGGHGKTGQHGSCNANGHSNG